MKCYLVLAILILAVALPQGVTLAGQVEHAPTVATCQADQRLWLSELEEDVPKLPKFEVLMQWDHEIRDCQEVDPENRLKYYNTSVEIHAEQFTRVTNFIDRHGLWNQFEAEDAAGKR